jgi:hypothetical protein
MPNAYAMCPVCQRERQTTRTGAMASHKKWNGKSMVPCEGTFKFPRSKYM